VLPTICAPEAALPAVDPTVTCSAAETVPDTTDSFDTTAYDTPPTPSVQSSPNAAVDPNGSQTSTPLDAEAATHDDTDTGSPTCSASSQMSNGTSDYYNCHGDTPTADPAVAPFANTSARLASLLSVASGIGPGRSLETKILDIQTRVAAAQKTSACDALASFVNEVGAQADKQISTDQANMLTTKAEEIESALGC
jgi:hypothetical protein